MVSAPKTGFMPKVYGTQLSVVDSCTPERFNSVSRAIDKLSANTSVAWFWIRGAGVHHHMGSDSTLVMRLLKRFRYDHKP